MMTLLDSIMGEMQGEKRVALKVLSLVRTILECKMEEEEMIRRVVQMIQRIQSMFNIHTKVLIHCSWIINSILQKPSNYQVFTQEGYLDRLSTAIDQWIESKVFSYDYVTHLNTIVTNQQYIDD